MTLINAERAIRRLHRSKRNVCEIGKENIDYCIRIIREEMERSEKDD